MDPLVTSALISTGGSLLGGLFGKKQSAVKAYNQAAELQNLQIEGLKKQVPAMVEGAKNAGIHPLAALGISPMAGPSASFGSNGGGNASMLSDLGQNLGRVAEAAGTVDERKQSRVANALALEHAALQNDLLRSQITSINRQPGTGPGLPTAMNAGIMPGQGNSIPGTVDVQPVGLSSATPGNPSKEAGGVTDFTFARSGNKLYVVPSRDVKERIEDNLMAELSWSYRNQVSPYLNPFERRNMNKPGRSPDPREWPLPPGAKRWVWNGTHYVASKY